jgi:D-beta-D-heptose 7-phosphate kinase/D-beta-D-heptose 1-phosphate adenosyltransferase
LALERLETADALILSDYAKGVLTSGLCQNLIDRATQLHKPVVADPKGSDFRKYQGVTAITPNKKEAEIATGVEIHDDETLERSSRDILRMTAAHWVMVTRGAEGISVFAENCSQHVPAIPVEVYDVAGAGDTVVAVLGAMLALDVPIETAAHLANVAASCVIQKPGVVSIKRDDLISHYDSSGRWDGQRKIKTVEELETLLLDLRRMGKRIVSTNGCFDLLHVGHIRLLTQARQLGDVLIVALNSDASVRRLKGDSRPVIGQEERAELLAALTVVDYVAIFEEDTPEQVLERLKVDIHVKGGDYSAEGLPEAKVVQQHGGSVRMVPYVSGYSTSDLITKIRSC